MTRIEGDWPAYPPAKQPEGADRRGALNAEETEKGRHGEDSKESLDRIDKIVEGDGGAGAFAEEAKRLGFDRFVTGEADWGEVIAAENCGLPMDCLGHYETEVGGVRAVVAAMQKALNVQMVDLTCTHCRETIGRFGAANVRRAF